MRDEIHVSEAGQWDGRYPFDTPFDPTLREWIWIKELTGYMPLTFDAGVMGGDAALIAVLALIAMRRSGKITADELPEVWDRFQDLAVSIRLVLAVEDEGEDPTQASRSRSSSESESSSGTDGPTSSESSVVALPPTGTHGWDSSESA